MHDELSIPGVEVSTWLPQRKDMYSTEWQRAAPTVLIRRGMTRSCRYFDHVQSHDRMNLDYISYRCWTSERSHFAKGVSTLRKNHLGIFLQNPYALGVHPSLKPLPFLSLSQTPNVVLSTPSFPIFPNNLWPAGVNPPLATLGLLMNLGTGVLSALT